MSGTLRKISGEQPTAFILFLSGLSSHTNLIFAELSNFSLRSCLVACEFSGF